MDTRSGEIYSDKEMQEIFLKEQKAKVPVQQSIARFMVEIPEDQLHHMEDMNRAERRKFWKENRKMFRKWKQADE